MDEAAAFDFDQAAAWVLQMAEDRKAIELLKAQSRAMWGGGGDDSGEAEDDLQTRANEFFN